MRALIGRSNFEYPLLFTAEQLARDCTRKFFYRCRNKRVEIIFLGYIIYIISRF